MSISGSQSGYSINPLLRANTPQVSKNNATTPDILSTQSANISGAEKEDVARTQATFSQILLSSEAHAVLLSQQEVEKSGPAGKLFLVNTNKGNINVDLDEYFSDKPSVKPRLLNDVSLLLPSAENIAAMSEHASARFKEMLAEHNIPSAPDVITYDNEGKMQLPHDYPYAEELKQALNKNPGLARELSTINAITSHYVEIQKVLPFQEAHTTAQSQQEADAICSATLKSANASLRFANFLRYFFEKKTIIKPCGAEPLAPYYIYQDGYGPAENPRGIEQWLTTTYLTR